MIGCKNLDDLKAAQFIMGPMYIDWVWAERIKASRPVPQSKMRVLFRWQNTNVIPMKRKGT